MLPFLKNAQDASASAPVESVERSPDEGEDYDTLSAVAEDILHAIEKKDVNHLKSALQSLVDHVQSQDMDQDNQTLQGD